jgi:hypothetical protein
VSWPRCGRGRGGRASASLAGHAPCRTTAGATPTLAEPFSRGC